MRQPDALARRTAFEQLGRARKDRSSLGRERERLAVAIDDRTAHRRQAASPPYAPRARARRAAGRRISTSTASRIAASTNKPASVKVNAPIRKRRFLNAAFTAPSPRARRRRGEAVFRRERAQPLMRFEPGGFELEPLVVGLQVANLHLASWRADSLPESPPGAPSGSRSPPPTIATREHRRNELRRRRRRARAAGHCATRSMHRKRALRARGFSALSASLGRIALRVTAAKRAVAAPVRESAA